MSGCFWGIDRGGLNAHSCRLLPVMVSAPAANPAVFEQGTLGNPRRVKRGVGWTSTPLVAPDPGCVKTHFARRVGSITGESKLIYRLKLHLSG